MDWTSFLTPGAPELSVLGETFYNDPRVAAYQAQYGSVNAAYQHLASERNADLLDFGQAIRTPDGLMSVATAAQHLQSHGYQGSVNDPIALASAYQLLAKTPPAAPSAPAPTTASASLSIGGVNLTRYEKPLLYIGAAYLAYELFLKRRR